MIDTFDSQFLGEWLAPTKEEKLLRTLIEEYHRRCEAYDRLVCTGPIIDGEIRPANGEELALVNRNAREVLKGIARKAMEGGCTEGELRKELGYYHKTRIRR